MPILIAFEKDVNFDGDNVHKATSIHLRKNVKEVLEKLSSDSTIYFKNKNELNETVGVTNNLRSLAANIKFTGENIPQNQDGVNGQHSVGIGFYEFTKTYAFIARWI